MASESYVVRIYRRDQHNPQRVAGVVEYIDSQQSRAFRSMSELMQLLAVRSESPRERALAAERTRKDK